MNFEKKLLEIENQEKNLVFESFNNDDALVLGMLLVEKGKKLNKGISINITRNNHQIFYYSFDGTSIDNDEWVKRKMNVVNRFNKSSLYIGLKLKSLNRTIEDKYLISAKEYSPYGGSFPIILKNTGVIGTITVSGLSQEEDHLLVVEAIKEYLKLH